MIKFHGFLGISVVITIVLRKIGIKSVLNQLLEFYGFLEISVVITVVLRKISIKSIFHFFLIKNAWNFTFSHHEIVMKLLSWNYFIFSVFLFLSRIFIMLHTKLHHFNEFSHKNAYFSLKNEIVMKLLSWNYFIFSFSQEYLLCFTRNCIISTIFLFSSYKLQNYDIPVLQFGNNI